MRDTVEMIVKALVDETDAVDVREIERDGTTRIEVRVAQSDGQGNWKTGPYRAGPALAGVRRGLEKTSPVRAGRR
jgi:hypothetical protein